MMEMYKAALKWNRRSMDNTQTFLGVRLLDLMKTTLADAKDVHKSVAKITPYFHPEFFTSEVGEKYKDSLLFNQEERAKTFLHSRTHYSNKTRDKKFWREMDAID